MKARTSHKYDPPRANALASGLQILQKMVDSPRMLGVTEIAAHLKLPKSSVHRMLHTLIDAGFVTQQLASRRYAVSPDIFRLVNSLSTQFGPIPRAYAVIKQESGRRGHAIVLSSMGADRAITICAVGPDTDTKLLGAALPVYISSPAKALIAQFPCDRWSRYAPTGKEVKMTAKTNVDPAKFLEEIAIARREKVAWNLGGSDLDTYSVATVVPRSESISDLAVTFVFNAAQWKARQPADLAADVRVVAKLVAKAIKAG